MRRLALVARSGRDSDAAHRWLTTLPSGGVWRYDRLADAPLDRLDTLWVSEAESDGRLLEWLAGGGRLLATLGGCFLPSMLGLEQLPPRLLNNQPAGTRQGLAGFGAHPLFEGLRHGALLAGPDGPGTAVVCYDGHRPAGGVVAVERFDLELHPDRIVAWEYQVGSGGILCIGMAAELLTQDPICRSEIEIVLANALVGDAIPHRERVEAVPLWPVPGRAAVMTASGVAGGVPVEGKWPASSLPALDIPPAAAWTQAGRRLLVSARPAGGSREVWAPPFRLMHEAMVRDATPCAPVRVAADEIAGGLALGEVRLLERWAAAADVAAGVWEITGQPGVPLAAEWAVDFRRAWPFPEGAYGDLEYQFSADGLGLAVRASGGIEARFAVSGGTMVAHGSSEAAVVRVVCTGVTPLRIVAVASARRISAAPSRRWNARGLAASPPAGRGARRSCTVWAPRSRRRTPRSPTASPGPGPGATSRCSACRGLAARSWPGARAPAAKAGGASARRPARGRRPSWSPDTATRRTTCSSSWPRPSTPTARS
jgi:hypothetical protein